MTRQWAGHVVGSCSCSGVWRFNMEPVACALLASGDKLINAWWSFSDQLTLSELHVQYVTSRFVEN